MAGTDNSLRNETAPNRRLGRRNPGFNEIQTGVEELTRNGMGIFATLSQNPDVPAASRDKAGNAVNTLKPVHEESTREPAAAEIRPLATEPS